MKEGLESEGEQKVPFPVTPNWEHTTTSIIMLPFPPLKLLPPSVYTSCDTTAVMKNMDTPADVMPREMNGSAVGNTRIPSGEGCGQPRRAMKIAGT